MMVKKGNRQNSENKSSKRIGGSNFLVSVQHNENQSWQGVYPVAGHGTKSSF